MNCPYLNYRDAQIKFMIMSDRRLCRSRSVSTAINLIYDSGMVSDGCWWIRSVFGFDLIVYGLI
jgi:hypothetical protein